MYESNVKSYCKSFPQTFQKAKSEYLYSENKKQYLDFFAGAGALNYGHNNDFLKEALIEYIEEDFLTHGLDLDTSTKKEFVETFKEKILKPRRLNYLFQFTSPSGTNANEAAIKLAKKYTGRRTIFSFTGGFHGMSEGSLAVTGNKYFRDSIPMSSSDVVFVPFETGFMKNFDSIEYIETLLEDPSSGVDIPAAMILETVQAEGGINVASSKWLRKIRKICDRFGILLICDEIQVGCGRTGKFFSFEDAGIVPDIVTLSKSLSGYGLPMSMVLLKPELDCWNSAEHNGTFRGNQHAFVTAAKALELREKLDIDKSTREKSDLIFKYLQNELSNISGINLRGKGLIIGIDFKSIDKDLAKKVSQSCFKRGLIIECAGRFDEVLKILPSLTISEESLLKGLNIIIESIKECIPVNTKKELETV